MKTILYILILSCSMSFLFTASAQDHREIFEGKAKVGPLNPVLRSVTIKDTDTKPRLTNPFFLDFQIVHPTGNFKDSLIQGQVNFEKRGEIMVTSKERPLTIRYALPEGLQFNQQLSLKEAFLNLNTSNSPSGAQKRIVIKDKNLLDTAFFWETHGKAFSYKTAEGLRIEQEATVGKEQYEQTGYRPIPLAVFANGQKQKLELGKPLRFTHRGNDYIAYALESSYLNTIDDGGCANGGYVVRLVISKSITMK